MNKAISKFNLVKNDEEADDALVQLTASAMIEKLAVQREKGYGGWWDRDTCNDPDRSDKDRGNQACNADLQMMLEDHVAKGHELTGEAAARNYIDICNLSAMMAARIALYGDDA